MQHVQPPQTAPHIGDDPDDAIGARVAQHFHLAAVLFAAVRTPFFRWRGSRSDDFNLSYSSIAITIDGRRARQIDEAAEAVFGILCRERLHETPVSSTALSMALATHHPDLFGDLFFLFPDLLWRAVLHLRVQAAQPYKKPLQPGPCAPTRGVVFILRTTPRAHV